MPWWAGQDILLESLKLRREVRGGEPRPVVLLHLRHESMHESVHVRLYADDLVGSFKLAVKRRPQQHSSPRSFRNPSPLSLPSLKRNQLLGALEVRDDARPSNCSLTDLLFPFFAALSCEGLGFNLPPGKIGGDHLPWSADSRWGPRR